MICVEHLYKSFQKNLILNDINFTINKGEVVSIIGPSGHGKTTLLRCIQGLESYEGSILKTGTCGFVFQQFYLFPHMTAFDNIVYALIKTKGVSSQAAFEQAMALLSLLHMEENVNKYPHELSGGQKQRIALMRALVLKPDILLLDEPTSALDLEMKKKVEKLLSDYQDGSKVIVFISHDAHFSQSLATRSMTLKNGILL